MTKTVQADPLASVMAELQNPVKNAKNPHFRNEYADLASICAYVRETLGKPGCYFMQPIVQIDGGWAVETQIYYGGEKMVSGLFPLVPAKQDPQGYGSATTYARRYGLCSLLGIAADDDDDGNEGSKPADKAKQPPRPPAQRASPKAHAGWAEVRRIQDALSTADSLQAISAVKDQNRPVFKGLPLDMQKAIADRANEMEAAFKNASAA